MHVGKAYHEVPFSELSLPTHRHNLNVRVNLIKQEMTKRKLAYKGKYGLDIGCSVGGLSFSMTKAGAKQVLGVDYDPLSINVGNAIESHYKTGAVFLEDKVSLETLPALIEAAADPATGRINFCLWFSQFMWLLKQTSLEEAIEFLRKLTNVTDVLWFESSQGDMAAGDAMRKYNLTSGAALEDLLRQHTPYQKIINLGNAKDGWGNREVILCYAPIDAERFERKLKFNAALQETKNMRTKKGVTSLVYINGTSVIKQYKDKYLPFCFEPELDALKALAHESGNISRHFPKVMFATSPYIEMSHCGSHLSKGNMPADHERQAQEILEGLKHRDIVHRDIWPGNLMVKNDIIQLIDFGWATSFKKKEIKPKEAAGLGQRWKAKKGFDDTYSLNESFKSILA